MPRLSEAQLAERATGLGATDVAVAAGVSPYQTAYELYLSKIGELDVDATIDDAARGRMERGHRLEDVALEWDRDITGDPFVRVNRTIWHKRLPFLFCHPDAARDRRLTRLVEVKTSSRKWDDVPRHVEVQVQTQMAVTGARATDVLVLGFDGPPARLVVERDDELIAVLEDLAAAFWDRVQRRDPPPIDGSDGARRWLARTRWRDEPDQVADPIQRELVAALLKGRVDLAQLQAEDDRLANAIQLTMAGGRRLTALGLAKIDWQPPRTKKTVAWKEIAAGYRNVIEQTYRLLDKLEDPEVLPFLRELLVPTGLDAVESLLTRESEPFRPFVVTPFEREDI